MSHERSFPYQTRPSESLQSRIEQALSARYYVIQETGPLSFIIKEDPSSEKKFKVCIGRQNTCTCGKKHKIPSTGTAVPQLLQERICTHILFVLLKIFRAPRNNSIVWQIGLIQREIDELISGRMARMQLQRQSQRQNGTGAAAASDASQPSGVKRKDLEEDDTCPICYDTMKKEDQLIYCMHGCGKNMHSSCMKVWVNHRKKDDSAITCPLCRTEWDKEDIALLFSTPKRASYYVERQPAHRISCSHCRTSPVYGARYACLSCQDYNLCHTCFTTLSIHSHHNFKMLASPNQTQWEAAERPRTINISVGGTAVAARQGRNSSSPPPQQTMDNVPRELQSLQFRDIRPEDYDMLLDNLQDVGPRAGETGLPHYVIDAIPSQTITPEYLESLVEDSPDKVCVICMEEFQIGQVQQQLPGCRHVFHSGCLTRCLQTRTTCPICNHDIIESIVPPTERLEEVAHESREHGQQQAQQHQPPSQPPQQPPHQQQQAVAPKPQKKKPLNQGVLQIAALGIAPTVHKSNPASRATQVKAPKKETKKHTALPMLFEIKGSGLVPNSAQSEESHPAARAQPIHPRHASPTSGSGSSVSSTASTNRVATLNALRSTQLKKATAKQRRPQLEKLGTVLKATLLAGKEEGDSDDRWSDAMATVDSHRPMLHSPAEVREKLKEKKKAKERTRQISISSALEIVAAPVVRQDTIEDEGTVPQQIQQQSRASSSHARSSTPYVEDGDDIAIAVIDDEWFGIT